MILFLVILLSNFSIAGNDAKNSNSKNSGYSEKDQQYIKNTLAKISAAYGRADGSMPPCEGHRHTLETILQEEPPRTCKSGRELYEIIHTNGRKIREICEKLSDYMTETLQNRNLCFGPSGSDESFYSRNLSNLKIGMQEEFEKPLPQWLEQIEIDDHELLEKKPKGEFADPRCGIWPVIILQYRKKETMLLSKHFGIADYQIGEFCNDSPDYDGSYLDYLRYGEEKAFSEKNEALPRP